MKNILTKNISKKKEKTQNANLKNEKKRSKKTKITRSKIFI